MAPTQSSTISILRGYEVNPCSNQLTDDITERLQRSPPVALLETGSPGHPIGTPSRLDPHQFVYRANRSPEDAPLIMTPPSQHTGAPQGCVQSPLLFTHYNNMQLICNNMTRFTRFISLLWQ